MITIELSKKTVLSALGVVMILGLGSGAWLFAKDYFKPRAAVEEEAKAKKEVIVEMEPFVVNLDGQNSNRYLRASLSLVLDSEHDKQSVKEFGSRIRHGLIMLLSSKSAEGLLSAEGKSELRGEIVERINGAVGEPLVESVYFREFLIQ